jgi:hypothetical protein
MTLCSRRCRDAFDDGFPPYEETQPKYLLPVVGGGFAIACAHCKRIFSSKGLRRGSEECERPLCEAEETAKDPAKSAWNGFRSPQVRALG